MNGCFQKILKIYLVSVIILTVACAQTNRSQTVGNSSETILARAHYSKKSLPAAKIKPTPANTFCSRPSKVAYEKLSGFVNDYDKRRIGECLLVRNVPLFSEIENAEDEYGNRKGLYRLINDAQTDVGDSFITSPSLAKELRIASKTGAASLRVTCVLVEFIGSSDIYRTPYATKIEGLDENGLVLWTVNGKPPAKLKFHD
jgi:hypothetical protein